MDQKPNHTRPTLEEQNKGLWPMMLILGLVILAVVIVLFGLLFSIGDTTFGEGLLRSLALWGGGLALFGLPYLFAKIFASGDEVDDACVILGYIITGVIAVVVILIIVL